MLGYNQFIEITQHTNRLEGPRSFKTNSQSISKDRPILQSKLKPRKFTGRVNHNSWVITVCGHERGLVLCYDTLSRMR